MKGHSELAYLLDNMEPVLEKETYVFCTIPGGHYGALAALQPIASFQEKEGLTIVLLKCQADIMDLTYHGLFRCISLKIHSSLDAVGLTAAVSRVLADNGISANVIAAYFHDHIFVPEHRSEDALALLKAM
jgi:hypothetical protein